MGQGQQPRGWSVASIAKLPKWLAWPIYALAALLLIYLLYMIELGLFAFFRLGNEIVFSPTAVSTSGSLTVFFSALLALVGGPLVIWRVVTAHVQAQAARRQAEIAQEGHYTDLFTKAVEQLGATREVKRYVYSFQSTSGREQLTETEPKLEVRLGAIYALARIARDSERDHWPIMEVLCAYVHNPQNSREPKPRPDDAEVGSEQFKAWRDEIEKPRVDVQAALTVIGERSDVRVEFEN